MQVLWGGVLLILLIFNLLVPPRGVELLNISGVITYAFYFALGYYCRLYHCEEKILMQRNDIVLLVTFAISVGFVFLPNFWGKKVITAVNGIVLMISLGGFYCNNNWKFFNHLDGCSFTIYLYSWFFQVASQQLFIGITGLPWLIGSFLAFVTGVYGPWLIYKWIMKNKNTRLGQVIAFISGIK